MVLHADTNIENARSWKWSWDYKNGFQHPVKKDAIWNKDKCILKWFQNLLKYWHFLHGEVNYAFKCIIAQVSFLIEYDALKSTHFNL